MKVGDWRLDMQREYQMAAQAQVATGGKCKNCHKLFGEMRNLLKVRSAGRGRHEVREREPSGAGKPKRDTTGMSCFELIPQQKSETAI